MTLSACWSAGACQRPNPAPDVTFEWTLAPERPVVGPAVLTLRVLDRDRRPLRAVDLRVEAHMSHPGMAPLLAATRERAIGVYDAELQFSMRGDWILLISGSLANGATLRHRIDVSNVRPPG
ncbi:MAG: FixH family protein [Vicinamibacterales bacterium]